MTRWNLVFGFVTLFAASPTFAADLYRPVPMGRFIATCEDLGHFCFAESCGRDQIAAAEGCRAQCRSSVVMTVRPATCPLPVPPTDIVLRRRG